MTLLQALGEEADLHTILANRERRAAAQLALLRKWGEPLISFSLTIPGPARDSEAAGRCFAAGLAALDAVCDAVYADTACAKAPMLQLERVEYHANTGPEALICVKAPSLALKRLMLDVEESHPLGRLFDLDVVRPLTGPYNTLESIGRSELGLPLRSCFVCSRPAAECRRAGRHSQARLYAWITELLLHFPQE